MFNIKNIFENVRASHQSLGCDLAKIFLTSKFSYLDFCNPTHKTETRTANMWELLIANHLDKSLCLANRKQGVVVRSHLSASANRQEQNHFEFGVGELAPETGVASLGDLTTTTTIFALHRTPGVSAQCVLLPQSTQTCQGLS
jgi:hypothetical protein